MYNLYNQIQIKGMYFFCTKYNQKEKKLKYIILQPGETIENVIFKWQIRSTKNTERMDI
jgi:hypothetical protein